MNRFFYLLSNLHGFRSNLYNSDRKLYRILTKTVCLFFCFLCLFLVNESGDINGISSPRCVGVLSAARKKSIGAEAPMLLNADLRFI